MPNDDEVRYRYRFHTQTPTNYDGQQLVFLRNPLGTSGIPHGPTEIFTERGWKDVSEGAMFPDDIPMIRGEDMHREKQMLSYLSAFVRELEERMNA